MYANYIAEEKGAMASKASGNRRVLLLCTDGGLHADFAFQYYCKNVRKVGDYLVMLFCPEMDLKPGENIHDKDGAQKLKQLVIDEGNRIMNDAKIIDKKLKENVIDGEVVVASTVIPPRECIIETSVRENVDIIILGARRLGQGLQQQGTTKQYVLRNAKVPVLICKHGNYKSTKTREGVKRFILAGSDCGLQASEGLKAYRKHIFKEGDYMLLVYVPKSRPTAEKKIKGAKTEQQLQEDLQMLYEDNKSLLQDFIENDLKMPGEVIIGEPDSNPGDTLLEIAKREGADLIVVGARGLSEQAYAASSRTSDKVANDSEVTVFMNKY